jgi:tetratricopeptide (TPR) repeat protein
VKWNCFIAIFILGASVLPSKAQNSSEEYITAFAGEIQVIHNSPTVIQAAREYIVGKQFANQGKHGHAVQHFARATELDLFAPAPWVGLAISLSEIGRSEQSLDAWREVLLRDSIHGDALLVVGLDDARLGNYESALRSLSRRWLQDDDAPVESFLRDATLLVVLRTLNHEKAYKVLRSDFQPIFDSAVSVLIGNDNRGAWLGVLQQLVDIGASSIAAQVTAAGAPHVSPKVQGSLLTVLPLLEASAYGDGSITEQMYSLLAPENELLHIAPKWNEPVPKSEALSAAAQTMSIVGSVDGAIRLNAASLAIDPLNALTVNNLAWMSLIRDGATEQVIALCKLAYELAPEEPYIMDTLGWMYVAVGEPGKGVPLFVEALRDSTQPNPETYDHLGDAYWLVGNQNSAVRAWQTAASILNTKESKQAYLEGYNEMVRSVWGISVATSEAMYDLELGEIARNVMSKLAAVNNGKDPVLAVIKTKNGVQ